MYQNVLTNSSPTFSYTILTGCVRVTDSFSTDGASQAAFDYDTASSRGRILVWGPNATTNPTFSIVSYESDGGAARQLFFADAAGLVGIGTAAPDLSLTVAAASDVGWLGRIQFESSANALLNVLDDGGTFGLQFNTGTAEPTVSACGTGPAVTAGSRNGAGEITLGTAATACTITFGAPAWTNTPFCVVEEETSADAQFISAISTTAFTVSGLVASDKFMWVCVGRI